MTNTAALVDRLVDALPLNDPDARDLVRRRVASLAADLNNPRLLGELVTAAEHPDPVTADDLADRAGVTYRQITYWTRTGWLTPANPPDHRGSGFPLVYDPTQITKARTMGTLVRRFAMHPGTAAQIADEITRTGRSTFGGITITRDGLS